MAAIVDRFGQPIRKEELMREVATPSLTGIRQTWQTSIASGLTPADLVGLLGQASNGYADDYLVLAEEMEERDLHYCAVLGTRKQAVSGLQMTVEGPDESAATARITAAVEELVQQPSFDEVADDLLDALGKAYSVVEILWETSASQWRPAGFEHRDPRWFMFDRETRRELRLRDDTDLLNGLPLTPFKFMVHLPRIKSGLPIRGGLARMAAFAWICKAYALKDWMAFAEVFGMPLRLGRYGPTATKDDVAVLKAAVANIGSDAAAILPESMKIDFQEVGKTGATNLFERLCVYLDKQISKCVLGQTMTTDDGASLSQAKVHDEVRGDIQRKDAKQLEKTLNEQLVRPFVDLNFGPQKSYPRICIHIPEPEDLKGLVEALDKLVPLGLEVEQSVIRDKFGLPEPAKDAKLLRPSAPPAVSPSTTPAPQGTARNAAQPALDPSRDTADEITDALQTEAASAEDAIVDEIRALIDNAGSYDEILAGLDAIYPKIDVGRQAAVMRDALALAYLRGRREVQEAGIVGSG